MFSRICETTTKAIGAGIYKPCSTEHTLRARPLQGAKCFYTDDCKTVQLVALDLDLFLVLWW